MDKLIYMAIGAGLYHYYRKYKDSQTNIQTTQAITPITTIPASADGGLEGVQSLLLSEEQALNFEKMCEQYRSNPNCVCRFYWDKYRKVYKIMELCPNFEYFYDRPSV